MTGCSGQIAPQLATAPDSAATPPVVSPTPPRPSVSERDDPASSSEASDNAVESSGGVAGSGTNSPNTVGRGSLDSRETIEPPHFFEGRETVTYKEFVDELRAIADELVDDPDVQAAHQVLLEEKLLSAEELPLESFSRARLAFESARDSGLWGIRGTVTDQMPWSDRIWTQWSQRKFTAAAPIAEPDQSEFPTAVAECDELGALFSILARDLGVVGFVGLHWPYWNHVVPVWQVNRQDGTFVRIIVPATQTFLDKRDTIGTTGMKTNRVIFPYVRKDRRDQQTISADLARYLLTQSKLHGGLSTKEFTTRRLWHRWNHRPGAPERQVKKAATPQ